MLTVCSKNQNFLYRQTRDWLVREMRTGRLSPGSKLPGERALANLLKISRGTARVALQGLEKEGFIDRIPSRGAFIKRRGEVRQTKLALIFPEAGISRDYLHYANWAAASEMQRGLLDESMLNNSVLSYQYFPVEDSIKYPEKYANKLVNEYDGVFFVGEQHEEIMKRLKTSKYPFVAISKCASAPYMTYNRQEICLESAHYLLSHGARDIKMLTRDFDSYTWPVKFNAMKQACEEHDIDFSMKNVIELPAPADSEAIYLKLKKLFSGSSSKLPDAFYCTSPEVAFSVLRLAGENNWKIPEDLMLMGYGNNIRFSPMASQLTHVELPHYEMGRAACRSVLDKIISDKEIPNIQEIKAKLIIGQTTKNNPK